MLKKTLLMLVAVAGLAAVTVLPAASAHTVVPALAKPSVKSCAPGNGGVPNYCEPACIVPALEGDSIRTAIAALKAADCRLGRIRFAFQEPKKAPVLSPKTYSVFVVVRQFPSAGTKLPYHARVAIWVRFNINL